MKKTALEIQKYFNEYPRCSKKNIDFKFDLKRLSPIFIVGAPRTGSTLIFQEIVKHFNITYISNLMSLCPVYMVLIAKIFKSRMMRYTTVKPSDLGYIAGLHSPSEAGAIYKQWFNNIIISDQEKKYIRNTVYHLSSIFNEPLVSKNLLNSIRMENINKIFPEARFIFLHRNPLYTAQSILLARKKNEGDINLWWSTKPKGYEKILAKSPYYQVLWQILKTEQKIKNFIKKYHPECLEIYYENFCDDVQLNSYLIKNKFNLSIKDSLSYDMLKKNERQKLSDTEWKDLVKCYNIMMFKKKN